MMRELDALIVKSRLFNLADGDMSVANGAALLAQNPGKHMLMGDDPRLPKMPARPTLMDFFKYRFGPANHLLQSARHAVKAGMDEKVVMACLVHDIGVIGFIRADHGYWGAHCASTRTSRSAMPTPSPTSRISALTTGRTPISKKSTGAPAITNGT
jgi:hypothetical protein